MNRRTPIVTTVAAIALSLLVASPSTAQIFPAGTTALEDVSAGAVRGRAPGRLVQDGVGRHLAFNDPEFARPEITDIAPPISRRAAFLSLALETLFDELNAAIDAFANLLRLRAGQGSTLLQNLNLQNQ